MIEHDVLQVQSFRPTPVEYGPDAVLAQLADFCLAPIPKSMDLLTSRALIAFKACQNSGNIQGRTFVHYITVLGVGGLWEPVFSVYKAMPVLVSHFISSLDCLKQIALQVC